MAGDADGIDRTMTATAAFAGLGVVAGRARPDLLGHHPPDLAARRPAAFEGWVIGAILALDLGVVMFSAGWIGVLRGARRFDLMFAANLVQVVVALGLAILLVPIIGIVGAAVGQLGGRLSWLGHASRSCCRGGSRGSGCGRVVRPGRGLRGVWGFSLPILAIHVANQIGVGTDVLIVGIASGATTVGLYAAGAQFARYVSQLVFPAVSVLLPSFSAATYLRPLAARQLLPRALRITTLIGTVVHSAALPSRQHLRSNCGREQPPN